MATIESLGFELERRIILFHRDTSMPDGSQLGYSGNPNDAINGNTAGETLLCNCPSGTKYLDKSLSPYSMWEKVEDIQSGLWVNLSSQTPTISGAGIFPTFNCKSSKTKNRYLSYGGVPSNISGFPIMFDSVLNGIFIKTLTPCSGWVRIRTGLINFYSALVSNTDSRIITGIGRALSAGSVLQIYIESADGMDTPTVQVHLL